MAACPLHAASVIDLAETDVPRILGSAPGDRLGYAVGVGDLDGDGDDELVVSAPGVDVSEIGPDAGAVYIFDSENIARIDRPCSPADAVLTITGSHPLERFGKTICVADVNDDGAADLLVGSPDWGPGERIFSGRVYVFLGPLAGGGTTRCQSLAGAIIDGARAGDKLGSSMAVADVLAADGPELLVSAYRATDATHVRAGSVYVVRSDALVGGPRERDVQAAASSELRGESEGDALRGMAVANHDPSSTVVVAIGAYQADGPSDMIDAGKVYLVRGDAIQAFPLHASIGIDASVILGPHPRSFLGRSIASGDMDGDGLEDIAVSAYASRAHRKKADASGEVFLVFGSDARPPDLLDLSTADVPRFESDSRWDLFGLPIMFADMNGDGRDDLIVSAQFSDVGDARRRCGSVYLFRGGPRSVIEVKTGKADRADVIVEGASAFDAIGSSLAVGRLTGEQPDLVVGAPDAGENELGGSRNVPSAGMALIIPAEVLRAN